MRTADSTAQAEAADAPLKPDQAAVGKLKRSGRQTKKTVKAGVQDEDKPPNAFGAAAGRPVRGKKAAAAHVKPAAETTGKIAAAAQQAGDVPEAKPEKKPQLSRGSGAAEQGPEEPDRGQDAAAGIAQPMKRTRGRPGKALAKESTEEPHQDTGEVAETAQQANKHGRPSRGAAIMQDEGSGQAAVEGPGAAQQAKRVRPQKEVAKKRDGVPEDRVGEAAGRTQQVRSSRLRARAGAAVEGGGDGRTRSGETAASARRLAALTESQAAADTLAKVAALQCFQGLAQQCGPLQSLMADAWACE